MRFIASATRAPLHSVWHGAQSEGGSHGLPKRKSSAHPKDRQGRKQARQAPHRNTTCALPLQPLRWVACRSKERAKAARKDHLHEPQHGDMTCKNVNCQGALKPCALCLEATAHQSYYSLRGCASRQRRARHQSHHARSNSARTWKHSHKQSARPCPSDRKQVRTAPAKDRHSLNFLKDTHHGIHCYGLWRRQLQARARRRIHRALLQPH